MIAVTPYKHRSSTSITAVPPQYNRRKADWRPYGDPVAVLLRTHGGDGGATAVLVRFHGGHGGAAAVLLRVYFVV